MESDLDATKTRGDAKQEYKKHGRGNSWGLGKHCQSLKKRVRFFHDFPKIIIEVENA